MTIALDPSPVTISDISPARAVKAPQIRLEKLAREAEFCQGAWEEFRPFILECGEQLERDWGYVGVNDKESRAHRCFLALAKPTLDSELNVICLPHNIDRLVIVTPMGQARTDSSDPLTVIPDQPMSLSITAASVPGPVLEIIHVLQCFFPGRIYVLGGGSASQATQQEGTERTLPQIKWLLAREMILREAFGCTYFRYLLDAARAE